MSASVFSAQAHVDGLLAWWALAGVDAAVGERSVDWLRPAAATRTVQAHSEGRRPSGGYPGDLQSFHDYLAASPDLPESRWPGPRVLPKGIAAPRLMIVVSAPDPSAITPGEPFGPDAMRLLAGMTRAIGLDLDECYVGSLSLTAPPGGSIEADAMDQLVARMRHHIALVTPETLLLLGDQASRALLTAENGIHDENLPFVNHRDGTVASISVIHPRLMLGQPSAKAEAWRSLQRLVKGWGQ